MTWLEDGYITGMLSPRLKACPVCLQGKQRVIEIATFTAPGYGWQATILRDKATETMFPAIGLTCGCYARLFRQIGHINHSMSRSGSLVHG